MQQARARLIAALLALAAPAWATLPAADDFERASLGANWTDGAYQGAGAVCAIVGSSDLTATGGVDIDEETCFWNPDVPTTEQYACAQTVNGADDTEVGVCVHMSAASGGAAVCCAVDFAVPYWCITQIDAGTIVNSVCCTGDCNLIVPGEFIGIQAAVDGVSFQCSASSDGTTWTGLGSTFTASPAPPDPGRLGAIAMQSADAPRLEVWEGGNGALPTGHVCGAAATTTTTGAGTTTTSTTTSTITTTTGAGTTSTTTTTTSTTTTSAPGSTTTTTTLVPCVPRGG